MRSSFQVMTTSPAVDQIDPIILAALAEDLGDGDVTTLNTIPPDAAYAGDFLVKAPGVIAGLQVAQRVFVLLDPSVELHILAGDGDRVNQGDIVGVVTGRTCDPVGRAGRTQPSPAHVGHRDGHAALRGRRGRHPAVILDTRKTAPGLRVLDKWAVRLGGGQNHRIGLYDMALIKDNHIAAVGSITEAVRRVREGDQRHRPIEVEVTNLDQLREALASAIDRILLDNMSHEMIRAGSRSQRVRFRWRHRAT